MPLHLYLLLLLQPSVDLQVSVENWERLGLAGHNKSSFHHVFSGCLGLATVSIQLALFLGDCSKVEIYD